MVRRARVRSRPPFRPCVIAPAADPGNRLGNGDATAASPGTPRAAGSGVASLGPARQAVRDLETARAAVEAVRGLDAGRLDLVTLPTLASDPIAEIIGGFRRRHPGVLVRMLEPDDASAVADLVRSGACE